MYTREILAPRSSPIEDGNPLTGTWNSAFDRADLMEIRKPYPYPLPRRAIYSRIKEWNFFTAQDEFFLFEAMFFNLKLYKTAQIFFYDKQSGEKFFFRKVSRSADRSLPGSLADSSANSQSSDFNFNIQSSLTAGIVSMDIDIAPSRRRPPFKAHLAYDANNRSVVPITVSVKTAERRIMCACKILTPVQGSIIIEGRHIDVKQDTCSGFFCDYKGFYPYRMKTVICSAIGAKENKRFGFHIADILIKEPNKNNENVLWMEEKCTPLPPVLITMPNGPDGIWVIQDVEGMIDLTFTPKEHIRNSRQFIITSADFNSFIGYYNGMLLTLEGERIQIKNLFGIGKKLVLRG